VSPTPTIIFVAYPYLSKHFTRFSLPPKVTVSKPHLKRTPTCCISPYTGMRMRPFTPTIPLEAIRQRERVEDSACVYIPILVFPFALDPLERSGYHTALVSHDALFLLISSVNIPWSKGGKDDRDYIYAFEKLVMPIAKEFGPEIVLGKRQPSLMARTLTRFCSFCRVRCCRGGSSG